MVIDDNIDIANFVKILLELEGFNVDVFNNPFLALEYFKLNPKKFSLVISDVRMPDMNGVEFVAKIKEIEPKVKAIFMTAFDVSNLILDIDKYNYDVAEIFQKPFSAENLNKTVKELLING